MFKFKFNSNAMAINTIVCNGITYHSRYTQVQGTHTKQNKIIILKRKIKMISMMMSISFFLIFCHLLSTYLTLVTLPSIINELEFIAAILPNGLHSSYDDTTNGFDGLNITSA